MDSKGFLNALKEQYVQRINKSEEFEKEREAVKTWMENITNGTHRYYQPMEFTEETKIFPSLGFDLESDETDKNKKFLMPPRWFENVIEQFNNGDKTVIAWIDSNIESFYLQRLCQHIGWNAYEISDAVDTTFKPFCFLIVPK